MADYRPNEAVINELRSAFQRGSLVPFLGAGMSAGAGLPDWYTLVEELAGRMGKSFPDRNFATADLLIDAMQDFLNRYGRNIFVRRLRELLDSSTVEPGVAYEAVADLRCPLVLTTNFDSLIERASRRSGQGVRVASRDIDIPLLARQHGITDVVKLNGDLGIPETLVLAREDFETYFIDRPEIANMLRNAMSRSDMLYLGCSLRDPHFAVLMGEINKRMRGFARPAYAVVFDIDDRRAKEFERRNVQLLRLDHVPIDRRNEELAGLLSTIPS